jgi:hypothetical protein
LDEVTLIFSTERLGMDLINLLASGEGADVELKCSDGAVLKAHSAVLLARWEYYGVLQRNIAAGMAGGVVTGVVDVSEHSAATMNIILHYLYGARLPCEMLFGDSDADAGVPGTQPTSTTDVASNAGVSTNPSGTSSSQGHKRDAEGNIKLPPVSSTGNNQGGQAAADSCPDGSKAAPDCNSTGITTAELESCGDCNAIDKTACEREDLEGFWTQLMRLMHAGDVLLLPHLLKDCAHVVKTQLYPHVALSVLLKAHQNKVKPMGEAALSYAADHFHGREAMELCWEQRCQLASVSLTRTRSATLAAAHHVCGSVITAQGNNMSSGDQQTICPVPVPLMPLTSCSPPILPVYTCLLPGTPCCYRRGAFLQGAPAQPERVYQGSP